jgi:hypothetical protein
MCISFILTLLKVFEGLRFLSGYLFLQDGIKVSEIARLKSTLSTNLEADYFLQMIYFDFAGFCQDIDSVRWNKSV